MGKVVNLYRFNPFEDDVAQVKDRLTREFGYKGPKGFPIDYVYHDITQLDPILREPFLRFWNTRRYDPSIRVGRFTLGEVVWRARFEPLAAFLVLSDLARDPLDATRRLVRRIRQLEHPSPNALGRLTRARQAPVKLPGWDVPTP